jgi:hypothetical protein
MNRITTVLQKIRLGFADAKYMFAKIPEIVHAIKHDQEKKLLKARLHQMTDVIAETYGDIVLSISKNVDIQLFQNITEDLIMLVAKYQEPLKAQARLIAEDLQEVMENSQAKQNKVGEAFGRILKRIGSRNGWEAWDLPSDKARHERNEAERKERAAEREKELKEEQREQEILERKIDRTLRTIYTYSEFHVRHPEKSYSDYEADIKEKVTAAL